MRRVGECVFQLGEDPGCQFAELRRWRLEAPKCGGCVFGGYGWGEVSDCFYVCVCISGEWEVEGWSCGGPGWSGFDSREGLVLSYLASWVCGGCTKTARVG